MQSLQAYAIKKYPQKNMDVYWENRRPLMSLIVNTNTLPGDR